ncbi:TetR/AcrR family transcriptional regulator [Nocardia sp. NEAU-G5]|uniref:TetR/AcrR family transcriptional regulator n=1 Tax=Nocardia albiluteola TaxID=2842303 RepID=A0ABS6B870_9NOCA|nr:TetR/AcrR family transcriptional regulator [Nocardia albiluteola]MBU3062591.1 TetR/AcrR family transcriptional regulator [Nocardia albiluteola]MBU3065575.1 TetR/AcrR family transcriptional regulator [Nocardia albiluteola]
MTSEQPRRAYNSERRREAALRNRAAVLLACRELLFRDGYHATTIRGVAECAGVSTETVYKTFGSKTSMVKALWDMTLAGDDEPVPMADRPQTQQIRHTAEPREKLRLYAAYVRGIHERVAQLWTVLTQAGPEIGEVLEIGEQERLTAVTAFVAHLEEAGVLVQDTDPRLMADALWALAGPQLYTQLTVERGWLPGIYEDWLAATLIATLLSPAPYGQH